MIRKIYGYALLALICAFPALAQREAVTGKQISIDKLEITGAPAKIRLTPDRTQILANGQDVAIVRVEILDAQNRLVPSADNEVTFSIKGVARIGNAGSTSSGTKPNNAFRLRATNGQSQVIVQSTGKKGSAFLTANAPGLQSAKVKIKASFKKPLPRAKGRLDEGMPGRMDYVHP